MRRQVCTQDCSLRLKSGYRQNDAQQSREQSGISGFQNYLSNFQP